MVDPVLPPSRFGSGYTMGAQTAHAASVPNPSNAPVARTNPLAIASFALAVLFGPFLVPATIPMALVARSQSKYSGECGTGLANAALIVSAIYAVLGVVVLILTLVVVR